jgi:hypothetical protein
MRGKHSSEIIRVGRIVEGYGQRQEMGKAWLESPMCPTH